MVTLSIDQVATLKIYMIIWLDIYAVMLDKGPVIIYDRGGPEENNILRENFSRPTQRMDKKFRGPLGIVW